MDNRLLPLSWLINSMGYFFNSDQRKIDILKRLYPEKWNNYIYQAKKQKTKKLEIEQTNIESYIGTYHYERAPSPDGLVFVWVGVITALLKHNSHTVHPCKVYISGYHIQSCEIITTVSFRTISPPQTPHPIPNLKQLIIYCLSRFAYSGNFILSF